MRFFRFILLAGLLLSSPLLRAQEDWDAVLDKYEQIALRCRDLRSRASGEVVARQEVTALLTELVRLRGILRQASGKMTPAQRERYARIRASYLGEEAAEPEPSAREPERPVPPRPPEASGRSAIPAKPERPVRPPWPGILPAAAPMPPGRASGSESPACLAGESHPSMAPAAAPGPAWHVAAVALAAWGDSWQGGLHLQCLRGRWGGYVAARTGFSPTGTAYECTSDGWRSSGGRFRPDGSVRLGEWNLSCGVVRALLPWLDVYAGAGFGTSVLAWRDDTGVWARVSDYSASGPSLDAGVLFSRGRCCLLGGVSWLTPRPAAGPFPPVFSVGLGIRL